MMNSNEVLVSAVKAAAAERDGRLILRCADAFRIAGEYSVGVGVIGGICNENSIKIVQCQLGCFK
jgi:hypothetical protein